MPWHHEHAPSKNLATDYTWLESLIYYIYASMWFKPCMNKDVETKHHQDGWLLLHAWMAFSFLFVLLFFCALPFFASVLPFFPYLDTGHMENNCICLQAKPSCKQNHWKCCAYFAGKMLAIWRATSKQLWGNGGATKSLVIFAINKSPTQVNYKKCGFLLPAHAQALELLESLSEPHSDTLLLVLLGA